LRGSQERKRLDRQRVERCVNQHRCPPAPAGGFQRSASHPRYATPTRRQDAANEHQRAEARQGKADTMSALSVKQLPPISTSGQSRTSASWLSAPRKAGQDARSFRKAAAANQHQRAEARQGKADTMSALSVKQLPVFP